jgi:hypothetical protein
MAQPWYNPIPSPPIDHCNLQSGAGEEFLPSTELPLAVLEVFALQLISAIGKRENEWIARSQAIITPIRALWNDDGFRSRYRDDRVCRLQSRISSGFVKNGGLTSSFRSFTSHSYFLLLNSNSLTGPGSFPFQRIYWKNMETRRRRKKRGEEKGRGTVSREEQSTTKNEQQLITPEREERAVSDPFIRREPFPLEHPKTVK